MVRWIRLSIIAALCIIFVFCLGLTAAETKQPKVGVSVSWSGNDFVVTLWETAQQKVRELGGIPIDTSAEGQTVKHIADIETLIAQGVDALIIQPYDTVALVPAVQQANRAGIPVICMDGKVAGGDIAVWVGSDNVEAGEIIARYLLERIGGKGNIVVFWSPTHSGHRERVQGLENVLEEYPDVKVIYRHAIQAADPVPECRAAMESILIANPDIDGVFCIYDMPAIGVTQAIEAAKREGIVVVGVDGDPMALKYIKEGRCLEATCAQSPVEIGEVAAELAMKAIRGEEIPNTVYTTLTLITKDNVDEYLK